MAMIREGLTEKAIPLDGRLILAEDASLIGENFQTLTNLRYTDTHKKAIGGMTKINSAAVMHATYLKPRSMFQFRKNQPAESHLLVQAYNSGETASVVLRNDTAIPGTGSFSGTTQWTDASGAVRGYFANAPQGQMVYTNGVESVIWGGDEMPLAGFLHYDNDDASKLKDYTTPLRRTDTDADGIATLDLVGVGSAVDANTLLLLHCNGSDGGTTFTDDSPTTPHTVTANGNANTDTGDKKFGNAAYLGDGTGDYLSIPDNADFDLSGGVWTLDFWCKLSALPTAGQVYVLYYQATDASNYMQIDVDDNGQVGLTIVAAAATVVTQRTAVGSGKKLNTTTFKHVAVVENGDSYRIFMSGDRDVNATDTDRAANYTGSVYLAANSGGTSSLNGWLDEIRLSNVARWSGNFSPPSSSYSGSATTATSWYLASTRPLEAVKYYVGTANATANTLSGYYWNGSAWASLTTLVDGTSSGGASLAQTGVVTFDSTASVAKVKEINGTFLYWYRFEIEVAVAATTTLTRVTVRPAWQTLKDLWDGEDRPIAAFLANKDGTFKDFSTQVFENVYDSADSGTYAKFSPTGNGLLSTEYLYLLFAERMTGFLINLVEDKNNTTASTGLTVRYWNGSAWTAVNGQQDGTSEGGVSFAKSGLVSWDAPNPESEFKYTLLGIGNPQLAFPGVFKNFLFSENAPKATLLAKLQAKSNLQRTLPPIYAYQLQFSQNLSECWAFYVAGIPAPSPPTGYGYSFQADNRQFLVSSQEDEKNKAICCAALQPDVWQGSDAGEFVFGGDEELTCGGALYLRQSDSFTTLKVFFKRNEMWGLSGVNNETWQQYPISASIGCVAPGTLRVVNLTMGQMLLWQGADGLYLFDGSRPIEISGELKTLFEDGTISSAKIDDSWGWVDELRKEYHWCVSTNGTDLNKEYVLDLRRSQPLEGVNRWYEVNRGSATALQTGCPVKDTTGNPSHYGGIDTGYVERLDNGTTFDGNNIVAQFRTGDLLLTGSILYVAHVRKIKLIGVAKTVTANSVAGTYYRDTQSAGTAFTASPADSGFRLFDVTNTPDVTPGIFHGVDCSMTTSDEAVPFEPAHLSFWYDVKRLDLD